MFSWKHDMRWQVYVEIVDAHALKHIRHFKKKNIPS